MHFFFQTIFKAMLLGDMISFEELFSDKMLQKKKKRKKKKILGVLLSLIKEVGDRRRGRPEGSLFISYYTKV